MNNVLNLILFVSRRESQTVLTDNETETPATDVPADHTYANAGKNKGVCKTMAR